jgi:hypothetical protein
VGGSDSSAHESAAAAGVAHINVWEGSTTRTFTNATVRAIQNEGPQNLGRLEVAPMVYTEQDGAVAGRRAAAGGR